MTCSGIKLVYLLKGMREIILNLEEEGMTKKNQINKLTTML
jgi:hypothetical protein